MIGLCLAGFASVGHASGPKPEEPEPIVLAHADSILGLWRRGEGEAIIEVRRDRDIYRGVIVWCERRPETVGIEVFRDLQYDAELGRWEGRAYSIKRKREVRIDIEVPAIHELELTAHILIFKREVAFHRVPGATLAALRAKSRL